MNTEQTNKNIFKYMLFFQHFADLDKAIDKK